MTEAADSEVRRTARVTTDAMAQGVLIKLIRFVLAFASHVVIRRALGPEVFGQYLVAQLWLEMSAAVASLGMGQAVLRFLPEVRLGQDAGAARRLLAWALGLQLVGWAAVVTGVFLGEAALTEWLRGSSTYGLVLLVAYLLGARLVFDIVTHVYHAVLDVKPVTLWTIVWQVVFLAGLATTLARGGGAAGVVISAAVANVVGAAGLMARWRSRLGVRSQREGPRLRLRRVLGYGLPFAVIGLLYSVVWRASEGLLINHYWGEAAAGYFGAAYSLPQLVLEFVPTAVWPVVMASYATVFTLDRQRAAKLVEHYYKLLFLVVAPLSVGGVLFGDHLFLMVYGEAYAPGASLARVFFAVQCVSFVGTPLSMSLYILEKSRLNLLAWAGAAVINVGLDLMIIPIDWRWGAVLPVAIAVAFMPVIFGVLLRREGFVVHVPWRFIGRVYAASLALALLLPVRLLDGNLAVVGVSVAIGAPLLLVAFRVVRVFRSGDAGLIDLIPWTPLRRTAVWMRGGVA